MIRISPSILAADFSRLKEEIAAVEKAGADSIHLDIMDGHFVPNISYGPPLIASIRKVTGLSFWAHLMIEEPGRYLKSFKEAGADGIIIHQEVKEDAGVLARKIDDLGLKKGIALNPDTSAGPLRETLALFDRILVMTVYPGFGGQKFMENQLQKIALISSWDDAPPVEVDGGIDKETAPLAVNAGARILVAGSAIFRAADSLSALQELRSAAEAAAG